MNRQTKNQNLSRMYEHYLVFLQKTIDKLNSSCLTANIDISEGNDPITDKMGEFITLQYYKDKEDPNSIFEYVNNSLIYVKVNNEYKILAPDGEYIKNSSGQEEGSDYEDEDEDDDEYEDEDEERDYEDEDEYENEDNEELKINIFLNISSKIKEALIDELSMKIEEVKKRLEKLKP